MEVMSPVAKAMSPVAKGLQLYLMNRLLLYVYREFQAAEKRGVMPYIPAEELAAQFPDISEPILRKRLKHCADLQVTFLLRDLFLNQTVDHCAIG